jgi:hypothetical protein
MRPGCRDRIPVHLAESFAFQEAGAVIQPEQSGSRLSDRRQEKDRDPVRSQMEVIVPSILAWIEETDQRARSRDDRSNVAPLVSVTREARIREIALRGLSSMLFADDMIDLTTEERIVRVDEAVFAEVVGSCRHKPPEIGP